MPKAPATKATIKRYVEAARELGLKVVGFEVTPDGTVRVFEKQEQPKNKDRPGAWN
ncbi:MAG: hypothetical protein AAGF94_11000 [Pseudomonadota bacterium]